MTPIVHRRSACGAICLCAFMLLACGPTAHAQNPRADWFVDATSTVSPADPDIGISWDKAFTTLVQALNHGDLDPGDTIWVAKGTYVAQQFGGAGPDTHTLISIPGGQDRDGVQIKGGYKGLAGGALQSDRDNRDPRRFETILTGDLGNDDEPLDDGGVWNDEERRFNASVVFIVQNVKATITPARPARIDGFTIRGGRSGGGEFGGNGIPGSAGAGLYVENSSLVVANCIFEDNSSGRTKNEPTLMDPQTGWGGAVAVTVKAGTEGVADFVHFIDCTFRHNTASRGGAMAVVGDGIGPFRVAKVKLVNCVFHNNQSVEIDVLSPDEIDGTGGALYIQDNAAVFMHNCTIADNNGESDQNGASGGTTIACLGGSSGPEATMAIFNSILWGNTIDGSFAEQMGVVPVVGPLCNSGSAVYSDIEMAMGVFTGIGNLNEDPDFQNPDDGQYWLDASSPVINEADTPSLPTDSFDVDSDGNTGSRTPDIFWHPRPHESAVDMGAYEFLTCAGDFLSEGGLPGNDGEVGILEFLAVLAQWGATCPCPADVTGPLGTPDGFVGIDDFLLILGAWGTCNETRNSSQPRDLLMYASQYGPVSDTWDRTFGGGPWPLPRTVITRERWSADEFVPTETQDLTTVTWWGFYDDEGADCTLGYDDSFTITYYIAGDHPVTGNPVPDLMIESFVVTPNRYDSEETIGGMPLWVYRVEHPPVLVEKAICYWVEIINNDGDTTGPFGCHWRWAWSTEGTSMYSAHKPEFADSYMDALDPDYIRNLAFSLDIEFEQVDLLFACPTP